MTTLADIGEARLEVIEDRAARMVRCQLAHTLMETAARMMVLAQQLDPDVPGPIVEREHIGGPGHNQCLDPDGATAK